jgi:hypothetical protein
MELYLIIGPSNSGKTTIAKAILESSGKPIFCLGGDRTVQLGDRYQECSWGAVETLSSCSVLVDDLIATSPSKFVALQSLLCYVASHSDVKPVVICTHLVSKNNIAGLLSAVKMIVFTADKGNIRALSTVLSHFKFEKSAKSEIEANFLGFSARFGRFTLDVQNRSSKWSTDPPPPSLRKEIKEEEEEEETEEEEEVNTTPPVSASRLLARASDPEAAVLLYDLIYPRLPSRIKDRDHCIRLKSGLRGGREVVINFLDFIFLMVEADEKPSAEMRSFFNYVQSLVAVPRRLFINMHMQ